MMHVIPYNEFKDDDVINVAFNKVETCQCLIHDFLELYKGILQTKWQNY
jgi:hypothetical protein